MKTQLISYNEVNDAFEKVTKGKYYKPGNDSTTRPKNNGYTTISDNPKYDPVLDESITTRPPGQESMRIFAAGVQSKLADAQYQLQKVTAQRDELLAAITNLTGRAVTGLNQSATHDGLVNCEAIKRARVAIAKCEANK